MTWATKKLPLILAVVFILLAAFPSPSPTLAQGPGTHTVQAGENLFRIALRYNTTVEALSVANGIADPTRIYPGQVLVIPATVTPTVAATNSPAVNPAPATADPAPAANAVPATNPGPVYYTVQAGDNLSAIARAYGVLWTDIAVANGIADPNTIYRGQQLLIPGATAPGTAAVAPPVNVAPAANTVPVTSDPVNVAPPVQDPVPVTNPVPATNTGTRTHTVQGGEHLAQIARAYNISWPTIARANNITDPNQIYPGQVLTIPATDDGQGTYMQPATFNAPAAPPTITTGKQIVVDLSDQRVYAYENGQLLRSVSVSTGLDVYPTVQGDFNVYLKYDSQTMSGPGYYLPGVPYVMYFYQGYSLHGTYWHSNFGTQMSHGCVNMYTPDAQWFYNWAPIGTPVHVQA
ncbi:MAG: LysM peptidoglycan-binding domain-containing protein [Chloroflexi bacterium]|nr:LysM peptidoglycan-binding domain-containing protein [Chloroflexota bacterium]